MKRIFLFLAAAFLLVNCNTTGDTKKDTKENDTTETKPPKPKDNVKKPDIKEILETPKEEIKKEDGKGWPEDRQQEVLKMCRQDAGDMPEKNATAYCNCQLGNLMKIFDSYKAAVDLFNKGETDLSEGDMKKAEMFATADESCWDQNMSGETEEEGNGVAPRKKHQ